MKVSQVQKRLETYCVAVSCAMVLAMLAVVMTEVIYRIITGFSTFLSVEFGSYLLAASVALTQAHTLEQKGHVSIDSIINRASPGLRRALEALWTLLGLAVVAILTYYVLQLMLRSYSLDAVAPTYRATPLFIPQSVIVLGMVIFTFRFALQAYQALASLFGRPVKEKS